MVPENIYFFIVFLLVIPFGFTQQTDGSYIVEPTPTLALGDEELTTVLLVSNDNRTASHGRYLNVRPNMGILTSTARTFIQEGVTTEYATQIVGTTLENGRIYAQLLKKSSRVLFDKDNVVVPSISNSNGGFIHTSIIGEVPVYHQTQSRSLLLSHNDLEADKDWQDIDDRIILEKNTFVGNTDYVGNIPKRSHIVFAVEPTPEKNQSDYTDSQSRTNFPISGHDMKYKENTLKIMANKVQPSVDLLTFTVKNMFSPSGFSWEDSSKTDEKIYHGTNPAHLNISAFSVQRSPKFYYDQVIKTDQSRTLSTVTYYGFADFTTVVGESVIVFSPKTSDSKVISAQVTSIKGKATIGPQESSYVSQVPITITQDLIEPTFVIPKLSTDVKDLRNMPTVVRDNNKNAENDKKEDEANIEGGISQESFEKSFTNNLEKPVVTITTTEKNNEEQENEENSLTTLPPIVDEQETESNLENNQIEYIELSSSMSDVSSASSENNVQTPTPTTSHIMLSRPSDEEILKIYSSLAKAEAEMKKQKTSEIESKMNDIESTTTVETMIEKSIETTTTTTATEIKEDITETDIQIKEGASTYFFDNDSFLDYFSPSALENPEIEQTKSFDTTSNVKKDSPEMQVNSILEEDTTIFPSTESNSENNNNQQQFKPIIREIDENEEIEDCVKTSQVYLTQVPTTLTLSTNIFVPLDDQSETTSSIETNIVSTFDISQATKYYCIQSTRVIDTNSTIDSVPSVLDSPLEVISDIQNQEITTPTMIIRENSEVTEASEETTTNNTNYEDEIEKKEENTDDDYNQESEEEIEFIYKTLFTTYTYLTTFFQDSTTSVSSHKEIVTNIITSSKGFESSSEQNEENHEPSTTILQSTIEATPILSESSIRSNFEIDFQSSDLFKIDEILSKDSAEQTAIENLGGNKISKTFLTTYTYFTTIFVDGDTEIMSRTEVHTNVVDKSLSQDASVTPSARNLQINDMVSDEDNVIIDLHPTPVYEIISRTNILKDVDSNFKQSKIQELESSSSSSSSKSEKKIVPIMNFNQKSASAKTLNGKNQNIIFNGILDDQISSESNTEEIFPSATLLLQTSYTTFTYYTTMYSNDAVNVASRLETLTNIVTETLQPTKTVSSIEASFPITYFTTFTYWTKLAKDGDITTLSREETISNVVTQSASESNENTPNPNSLAEYVLKTEMPEQSQVILSESSSFEPTTYYTTYTYFTTSYVGDQTVTDSRFETITNVLASPSVTSSIPPSVEVANKESDLMEKENMSVEIPSQNISFDFKKIVDAEGISTLYLKTQVFKTVVDGTPTEITSSTSTINIDSAKKELIAKTSAEDSSSETNKTYKTGLVRLIDGTKLYNKTTTVYQSKVIGTIIDNRYAQIIESTSSFIIGKTSASNLQIEASSTLNPAMVESTIILTASNDKALESSIYDSQEDNNKRNETDENNDENQYENGEEEDDDENGRTRTRLSFQTKKKTFTPVIRPFVSRNRPQFAPKRKNILQSSATIITRSDLTPTITATPAIKSDGRSRFSSSRKNNLGLSSVGAGINSSQGGKRFGRPSKSSQFATFGSSVYPGSSSRNRVQSVRGSQGFSSSYNSNGYPNSRKSGGSFRGSSTTSRSFSSAYPGNSRLGIRASSFLPYDSLSSTASYTTLSSESGEDDSAVTQIYDKDTETDFTTENLRRNNNNLLRLRRPQLNRPAFQVSPRRNPLTPKPRTTSKSTTTTQRTFSRVGQRPSPVGQLQNRSRPQNSLFPSRRLFPTQNTNQGIEEGGEDFENVKDENDSSDYENDDEGLEDEERGNVKRSRRQSYDVLKSLIKKRSKRQANNFRNRYRRPSTARPTSEDRMEDPAGNESSTTTRSRSSSRFTHRTHSPAHTPSHSTSSNKSQNNRAIRPAAPNRAQFTLREKDTTSKYSSPRLSSNFRRPLPNTSSSLSSSSRRTTTSASRPKTPRAKNYGNPITEATHSSSSRGRTPSNGRSRSTNGRSRNRNDFTTDPIIPVFDGILTVTHTSPTEITIPIVNGKITEYKNVLTTTTSTEIIPPNLYTTIVGQFGSSTIMLSREETSINSNGATEVTQFILHEQPTTTVIFTPTTIRGRKTSFAHMIPSTAYQVENIVSTMQPQLAANAPLANILLSQLLLGNLGNLNQPNINPLLVLGGATQANSQIPGVPTTEFKTRSSTYVTTLTNGMSTVIPLTFHGKEILTTIYDSSSEVITATEYFTDTIVVTPSQQAQQVQQVNSLLLPYLLQQQLQGQSPQLSSQPVLPIQNSIPSQLLFPDNLQDLDHNGIHKYNDYSQDIEDYPNITEEQIIDNPQNINTNTNSPNAQRSSNRKKGTRKSHKQHLSPPADPSIESSVITLYVSGRRPGEFSTILSTVHIGSEPTLRKRQIFNRVQPLFRSTSPDEFEDYFSSDGSEIEEFLLPANRDIISSQNLRNNFLSEETQSLESIIGDVSLWYSKTSAMFASNSNNAESSTLYEVPQRGSKIFSSSYINMDSKLSSSIAEDSTPLIKNNSDDTSQPKNFLF